MIQEATFLLKLENLDESVSIQVFDNKAKLSSLSNLRLLQEVLESATVKFKSTFNEVYYNSNKKFFAEESKQYAKEIELLIDEEDGNVKTIDLTLLNNEAIVTDYEDLNILRVLLGRSWHYFEKMNKKYYAEKLSQLKEWFKNNIKAYQEKHKEYSGFLMINTYMHLSTDFSKSFEQLFNEQQARNMVLNDSFDCTLQPNNLDISKITGNNESYFENVKINSDMFPEPVMLEENFEKNILNEIHEQQEVNRRKTIDKLKEMDNIDYPDEDVEDNKISENKEHAKPQKEGENEEKKSFGDKWKTGWATVTGQADKSELESKFEELKNKIKKPFEKKLENGQITDAKGNQYRGEMHKDKKEGYGELLFWNGDKYKGQFRNDSIFGLGTFWSVHTGCKMEGKFKNQTSGNGKIYFLDGSVYEGEFKDKAAHGGGKYTNSKARTVYEGGWYKGMKEGKEISNFC